MNPEHKRLTEEERADLKWVLSSPQGRRSFWRILEVCGIHRSSFHASGSVVYFNEGMRNIGLVLESQIIAADPNMYVTMMIENREGEKS